MSKTNEEKSANDATLKRTVAPSDVFNALTELEFDSFRTRLEQELEAYTETKAGKRKPKKSDVNGGTDAGGGSSGTADAAATQREDENVEMVDNPAKRVKRDSEGGDGDLRAAHGDGDETQEEEDDDDGEDEEQEEEEDEEEEEDDEQPGGDDIDRVEDLDSQPRPMDPDADAGETDDDDDDGPGSQLRDDMGLG